MFDVWRADLLLLLLADNSRKQKKKGIKRPDLILVSNRQGIALVNAGLLLTLRSVLSRRASERFVSNAATRSS